MANEDKAQSLVQLCAKSVCKDMGRLEQQVWGKCFAVCIIGLCFILGSQEVLNIFFPRTRFAWVVGKISEREYVKLDHILAVDYCYCTK